MTTLSTVISSVRRIVQDRSYSSNAVLLGFINRAVGSIIGKVTPPSLIVIDKQVKVLKGKTSTKMPDDFFYPKIFMVRDSDGKQFDFSLSASSIGKYIDAQTVKRMANADRCYVIGNNFVINEPAKEDMVFMVTYMASPAALEEADIEEEVLSYLPQPFGEEAVTYLASAYIYGEIEDGLDGSGKNFMSNLAKAERAILEISSIIGTMNLQGRPETIEESII